ncbi:MAG TPA: alcohol dehydrogenase catalytic domain-containing protein [Planctomycetota bacterium]|nr:alcohol dehydrogenase catalytic domain-containing protein [Planctomycetota bacterium]
MRAAVLPAAGAPVRVETIRDPRPKAGEVLLRVAACGLCHSDLHVAKGHLPFPVPCVLGHEISGIVEALGPGVAGPAPGQRAVASFIMPCARCRACETGRDDLCETYFAMNRAKGTLYDGQTRLFREDGTPLAMNMMGGLAELAVVPATDVFPLPPELPLEESCILGCALMTAYGAARHAAQLRAGQTAAVVGAGGVGMSLIQMARMFGAAEITAVDVRPEKLEEARRLGATRTAGPGEAEDVAADVVFEAVGRPDTVEQAFRMTRDGGRTVLVGVAPAGAKASIEINRMVRRGITLVGSFGCRVRTDMPELVRLAAAGRIDVAAAVRRRFRLEQIEEAYRALDRGEIVGRAIIVLGSAKP